MPEVNWIAVALCAVSSLVIGGLWYSPALFARQWQAAAGLSHEQAQSGNMAMIFGGAFVLSLIAAAVFAMFLGPDMSARRGNGGGLRGRTVLGRCVLRHQLSLRAPSAAAVAHQRRLSRRCSSPRSG